MAAPPAKRQKRHAPNALEETLTRSSLHLISSDPSSAKDGRQAVGQSSANVGRSSILSRSSGSNQKITKPLPSGKNRTSNQSHKSSNVLSPKKPEKPIHTFFELSSQKVRESLNNPQNGAVDELDDLIEDEVLLDHVDKFDQIESDALVSTASKGHDVSNGRSNGGATNGNRSAPRASQRFTRSLPGGNENEVLDRRKENSLLDDSRPWAERFGPTNLEELAVHSKKVADVRTWLDAVLYRRDRRRLLILKGPSGTAKTTTVTLLGQAMRFKVLEWRNPIASDISSGEYKPMSAQFEDFLGRGGRFGSLETTNTRANNSLQETSSSGKEPTQVILVEEFPNTFTQSSSALQSFRSTIQQYLAASHSPSLSTTNQSGSPTPIVMIISETLLTTTSSAADSFTVHRLLGPQILSHPGVTVIEFNPIARTILRKALDLVLQKEGKTSGRKKSPGKRTKKRPASLPPTEAASLELITQREASLGIFHAVAKVVYNKREEAVPAGGDVRIVAQPPSHSLEHHREKRSVVRVDELMDEMGTDTPTFISTLHENYVLSCEAGSKDKSITTLFGCADVFSECDLLCPDWQGGFGRGGMGGGFGRGAYQGAGSSGLRQDEIAFHAVVRGILFALPSPVKRAVPPATLVGRSSTALRGKGDAFKMFYPQSLKLWHQSQEVSNTVDLITTRLGSGVRSPTRVVRKSVPGSTPINSASGVVENWSKTAVAPMPNLGTDAVSIGEANEDTAVLRLGRISRQELVLERLPYTAQIQRSGRLPRYLPLSELERITTFHGIGSRMNGTGEDDDDEGEGPVMNDWATDAAEGAQRSARQRAPGVRQRQVDRTEGDGDRGTVVEGVGNLVLSDDDIEDD
ncbi:MAG: Cell cycle checkpoint protein rad17 [Caeruleum heppii]|nr:MAG: Cell cycle checkpoint protein rad17 [Caeruleum heppii]